MNRSVRNVEHLTKLYVAVEILCDRSDAEQFAKSAKCETKILNPGDQINLE